MELLERRLDIASAYVFPADSISCDSQIWIELIRLKDEGHTLVELIQYGGNSLPDPHDFLIELNRAPCQPSGLVPLLIRIDRPAEDLSLQVAIRTKRVCCGQSGIDFDSKPDQSEGLNVLLAGELIETRECTKIVVVGLKIFGRYAFCALYLGALQLRKECANHAARHLVLQIEDIVELAVKPVRPKMGTRRGFDQLPGNANSIAGFAHTAFEHIPNTQLAPDLPDVDSLAFVGKSGLSRDDEQRLRPPKGR